MIIPSNPVSPQKFLSHIAGLRALAIILVVLFHLDGKAWDHGYLGVDVFLVISGYLLFRGSMKNVEQNKCLSLRGGG